MSITNKPKQGSKGNSNRKTRKYDPFRDVNRVKARRRPPQPVEGILKSVLKRTGIDKELARYRFVTDWEKIVGAQIAAVTQPEGFRGSTLVIRVSSSTWAQELSFTKDVLIKRLQRYLDEGVTLKDIHFYVAGARGMGRG